jgi:hypothetical protein
MNRLDFKIDFPSIIKMSDSVFIPKMYKVRQNFDTLKLSNFIEKLKGELTNKKDIMESLNGKKSMHSPRKPWYQ